MTEVRPEPVIQDRFWGVMLPLLAVVLSFDIIVSLAVWVTGGGYDGTNGLAFILTLKAIEYRHDWLAERRHWRWR